MAPVSNIIFGAVIDDTLGDEVRVTVIAAGFDGGEPTHKPMPRCAFTSTDTGSVLPAGESIYAETPIVSSTTGVFADDELAAVMTTPATTSHVSVTPSYVDEDDDLDIPDFLK